MQMVLVPAPSVTSFFRRDESCKQLRNHAALLALAPFWINPTSVFCIASPSQQRSPNMARFAAVCMLAAAACCLLRSLAFVPAPATRSDALTTATGAAVIATIPAGADAFVYKGTFSCILDMSIHKQLHTKQCT